jgi:hypothetical protein
LTAVKSPHEYFQRLCAMAAANETSPDEDQQLADHIKLCLDCKQRFASFNQVAAQLYVEAPTSEAAAATFASAEEEASERVRAKEKLLGNVRRTINLPLTEDQPAALAEKRKMSRGLSLQWLPSWATGALAAALLLAMCLELTQSWLFEKHSRDAEATSARLNREVYELRGELARLQKVPAKPALEASSKTTEANAQKLRAENEAVHKTLLSLEAARQREVGENAELQDRIRLLQSSLEVLRASDGTLEREKSELTGKVSMATAELRKSQDEIGRLTARNEELSQESFAHIKSAERQQKLLATDHDIREILGARSLHIIDVFDVSSRGEFERPFGRIFYTEGKSLIFYAFDLDQQKGLKHGAVFQAWGQRGVAKEDSRSLGTFYMDDPSQNRWVLKVDDSKTLSRIDYVFVTDSSSKESARPRGKPLLSAFLNPTSNHQ